MNYYRVESGVVVQVRDKPHPECPYSTDLPIECGMFVGNRTDAELAAAQVEVARKAKIAAIDKRTADLLATGAEYPAGSGHFHALDPDRIPVYEGAKNNRTILAYPKKMRSRTGGIVTLANANEVASMYAALLARYEAVTAVGTDLVEDALAATTTAQLEAIVDDRE